MLPSGWNIYVSVFLQKSQKSFSYWIATYFAVKWGDFGKTVLHLLQHFEYLNRFSFCIKDSLPIMKLHKIDLFNPLITEFELSDHFRSDKYTMTSSVKIFKILIFGCICSLNKNFQEIFITGRLSLTYKYYYIKTSLPLLNCCYWWSSIYHRRLSRRIFLPIDCWIQEGPVAKTWWSRTRASTSWIHLHWSSNNGRWWIH